MEQIGLRPTPGQPLSEGLVAPLGHDNLVTWMGQTLIKTMLGQMGFGWFFFALDRDVYKGQLAQIGFGRPAAQRLIKTTLGQMGLGWLFFCF